MTEWGEWEWRTPCRHPRFPVVAFFYQRDQWWATGYHEDVCWFRCEECWAKVPGTGKGCECPDHIRARVTPR